MRISRALLQKAAVNGVISDHQADRLWDFLSQQDQDIPAFRFTHILYYLGGLIAIGAMSLFMNIGWENFGGQGLLLISIAYAIAGIWLTEYFLRRARLTIPAGITATFVVVLTPLAVYGLQVMLEWWPEGREYRQFHTRVDWRWLMMELATLATGAVMLWRYRLPFLVMPVAVTLWYMSMDLAPFIAGGEYVTWETGWELRKLVSLYFGLLVAFLGFWVDIRSRSGKDFAFWLYLFGVMAFWTGLSTMDSDSELNKFLYLCVNLLMIFIGAILSRRVFAVFGGLGVAVYLGHLAHDIFRNSLLFPFALTLIGLAVVWLGIVWQRREAAITARLRACLPVALRELVERRH